MATLSELAEAEIHALHRFFEAWLGGADAVAFDRLESALASEFQLVFPSGKALTRQQLLAQLQPIRGVHGEHFRIQVRNFRVLWSDDQACLVGYEEWQQRPDARTARRSAALLVRADEVPAGVRWRYVHETWMPPDEIAADGTAADETAADETAADRTRPNRESLSESS